MDHEQRIKQLEERIELLKNAKIVLEASHAAYCNQCDAHETKIAALEANARQHEKDIQSLMKQAERDRVRQSLSPLPTDKIENEIKNATDRIGGANIHPKNVATEFHGKAPSLADGIYKSTLQEAARTGFAEYTVKDGKIISVSISASTGLYRNSPTIENCTIDAENCTIDPLPELKRVRNELGVLQQERMQMRALLHCPSDSTFEYYLESEVAPFIQAIVDLMQKHEFKGSTKDMPAQIAEWLKLFVHNTNALESINTRFEEKCAANASLQTQLAEANDTVVQLEQRIDRMNNSKPAVYFMRGAAKVDMAVAGKHRDSHGRICIEVRDPNS